MSWLIEAYLNETREVNKTPEHDHPKGLDMKTADDFNFKTNRKIRDDEDEEAIVSDKIRRKLAGKRVSCSNDYVDIVDDDYDNNTLKRMNHAEKKEKENINKFAHKHNLNPNDFNNNARAKYAVERHNNRHPNSTIEENADDFD